MTDFNIFHVDDCLYVAAVDAAQASAHVKNECGSGCGELSSVREVSRDTPMTRANVDDGEPVTQKSMTTVGKFADKEIRGGMKVPFTVCFDPY